MVNRHRCNIHISLVDPPSEWCLPPSYSFLFLRSFVLPFLDSIYVNLYNIYMIKICLNCNREFRTYYQRVKYCSHKCYTDHVKKTNILATEITPCAICGKSVEYYPSQRPGNAILCSKKCYYKYKKTLKPPNYIDDEILIKALKTAAKLNEHPYLSSSIYEQIRKENGLPSKVIIQRRFGTWKAALKLAQLPTEMPKPPKKKRIRKKPKQTKTKSRLGRKPKLTKDEAVADLLRVAEVLGQTPTLVEYKKHGKYSWSTLSRAITGKPEKWALSCKIAGLLPHTTHEGNGNGSSVKFTTPSNNVVNLQSTYEVRFAKTLNRWGEFWVCHQELEPPIKFTNPKGRVGYYRPDFYIPSRDIYFDTKGWFRKAGKGKMIIVHACNPDLEIYLVFKDCLALAETSATFDEWFEAAQAQKLFDWR